MATLVCLGGGIEGLPILERVRAAGHRLVIVDGNPQAPGFALADKKIVASCYDPAATVTALDVGLDVEKGQLPDGVLGCAIDAPNVAAAVAARYGLPGLSPAQAALSCDKLLQKRTLRAAGVPVPDFWDDGADVPLGIGAAVLKPVDSRGARGVIRLLPGKLITNQQALAAKSASPTGRSLLECWLAGPQFSTESLIQDGRVLWTGVSLRNYDRLDEYAPYVIEDGFDAPYGDDTLRQQINELIESACRALDWYQQGGGVVKGDLVLHNGQLYIIELAARLSGGFLSTHGWPLAYGMPFVDYAIELALGKPISVAHGGAWHQFVAQRYILPKPEWIGHKVRYEPKVLTHDFPYTTMPRIWVGQENPTQEYPEQVWVKPYPDIEFASWNIHAGTVIRPVTDHAARLGQAIAVGATPEQARERAAVAVEAMREGIVIE